MGRKWWGGLLVGLLGWSIGFAAAQGGPTLVRPSLDQYATTLPDIIRQANTEGDRLLALSAVEEFILRYRERGLEQLNFSTFSDLYTALFDAEDPLPADPLPWTLTLLRAWLLTHPIDLSQNAAFDVGPLHVAATAADFSGDGLPDALLQGDLNGLRLPFLAVADSEAPGGYVLLTTPLPVLPASSDAFRTLRLEDINADGKVEWAVWREWDRPDGPCSRLYLLVLEGDRVRDVANGVEACEGPGITVKWRFDWPNVSSDTTYTNPYGCAGYSGKGVEWTGSEWGGYAGDGADIDTFACFQTNAEGFFREGNLIQAAQQYGLALRAGHDDPARLDYARARLALINALLGRDEQALRLLAERPVSQGHMAAFLTRLVERFDHSQNAMGLCLGAYDFIAQTNAAEPGYPYGDVPIGGVYPADGQPPDPARAGCDPAQALEIVLARPPMSLDAPLADQLEALQVPVERVEAVPDQAGRWRVWLDGLDRPLTIQQRAEGYARLPEPTPSPPARPDEPVDPAWLIQQVRARMTEQEWTEARALFDEHAARIRAANSEMYVSMALDYWRAVILEKTGHSVEALAAYVAVYESAPDSAWGRLAALHLEPAPISAG